LVKVESEADLDQDSGAIMYNGVPPKRKGIHNSQNNYKPCLE
jgi:hypothetical protein